ncbi:MAG: endo-1,4-beta-xylanase [Defluviitaleaceae bacterium]|nr:endo-1,4-beta-xylanase [Defluviitaleaceae bacterium]
MEKETSLCKMFERYFMVGNILSPEDLNNPQTMAHYQHHYNAVTAENAMKPINVTSAPEVYNFTDVDMLVDYAEKNNMTMIGHTLIWHGQSAQWLNRNADDSPIHRMAAKANMEKFIKTYVSRYSGRIYAWDVINEVLRDEEGDFSGNWREYLRRESDNPKAVGHWYLAYANGADTANGESGADFVFDAFYFARRYDPHAILYYNDYNEEFLPKCDAIVQMVEDINEQWRNHKDYDGRFLIEGIGMQSHHNHIHTKLENIRYALERFVKTGLKISITEFDFTFGSPDKPANPLTQEQSKAQAEMFTGLFNLYMEFSKHIERVTIWGKNDMQSWRKWGSPTLFDGTYTPKEAFKALSNLK